MGVKSLDFQDFKTVYSLILTKQHLTDLGREEIKQIVASAAQRQMHGGASPLHANIRVRHNR